MNDLIQALEEAASSLNYIANTACKRDEELMFDAINVRGYARSRAHAASEALSRYRSSSSVEGVELPEALFYYRPISGGEMYEGPHHAKSVGGRMLREEKPGEWVGLLDATTVRTLIAQAVERARLDEAEKALQWRPIETAPKEGPILVWGPWLKHPFLVDKRNGTWVTPGNVVVRFGEEATHWLPLPPAPKG